MPSPIPQRQESISRGDIALWCLAGVMAIGLYLAPEKTPAWVVAGLAGMIALATHPTLSLPWVRHAGSTKITIRRSIAAMSVMVAIIGLYGWRIWPLIKRHTLSQKERTRFENALKPQKGGDLEVQIACPPNDERGCTYAGQFIRPVGDSGWKVQAYVSRLTLTKPLDGIVIYRRGGNRDYSLQHCDAGGYFNINEPHLLAMQKAFQSIHIEPSGGTDPDIPDKVMMIYFGPERENEAESTDLTKSTEWALGKRIGPFPGKRNTFLCGWFGLLCD